MNNWAKVYDSANLSVHDSVINSVWISVEDSVFNSVSYSLGGSYE